VARLLTAVVKGEGEEEGISVHQGIKQFGKKAASVLISMAISV
jgi:hypothetical protein